MRFKSPSSNLFQVFAVTGVNTISFGINASEEAKSGLLGFAVERVDPAKNERYTMPGFKVFESVIPNPAPETQVSTWDHPVQSFVWDDFTAKDNHEYEYVFHPIKGTPKNLDRSAKPFSIKVQTEPLFSEEAHDIFFNRGVASSQAYTRRFGDLSPKDLGQETERGREAIQWLTRDLDEAITKFIENAKKGDTLLGCFYEFRYKPVAEALKDAIDRDVNVRLIIDGKKNTASFPREDNLAMLGEVGIPAENYKLREAKPNNIQHNKFMVLLQDGKPTEVWTGSTNLSLGGFSGQTNVGHWVRDPDVAENFKAYWELLETDPGAVAGLELTEAKKANKALHAAVAGLNDVPASIEEIPPGTSTVFSPRAGLGMLDLYVRLVDSAKACSCITLAFGINENFKKELLDNTGMSQVVFMLLEKRDRPNAKSTKPFVGLTVANNVYQAWGSYMKDPVYRWARETNTMLLKVNKHVVYVHSKFLLMDPLGEDPIIVTGSANFSKASTNDNDENMLIIRGDRRVADIYFTEFNRLFNHYYFRSVTEALKETGNVVNQDDSLFLAEESKDWIKKYAPGKLRAKRLNLYTGMKGAKTL